MAPQKLNKNELYISVHTAPIFFMRHGIIVENIVLTFTKCFLHFQPPDTLQMFDENEICIFTTSAVSLQNFFLILYYYFFFLL